MAINRGTLIGFYLTLFLFCRISHIIAENIEPNLSNSGTIFRPNFWKLKP